MDRNAHYGIPTRVVEASRFAVTGVVNSGQCTNRASKRFLNGDQARMYHLYNLFYDRRTLLVEYLSD